MQFPTAMDSLPYAPLHIVDRSPIRTDLRSRWPRDDVDFIDDTELGRGWRSRPGLARIAGLVAVVALTMAATSALAGPAPDAPIATDAGGRAPSGLEFRLAPGHGMPASLYLD